MIITINDKMGAEITVNSDDILLEKRIVSPSVFSEEDIESRIVTINGDEEISIGDDSSAQGGIEDEDDYEVYIPSDNRTYNAYRRNGSTRPTRPTQAPRPPRYQYRVLWNIKDYELDKDEYERIKSILSGLTGDFLKDIVAKVKDEKIKSDIRSNLNALFRMEL